MKTSTILTRFSRGVLDQFCLLRIHNSSMLEVFLQLVISNVLGRGVINISKILFFEAGSLSLMNCCRYSSVFLSCNFSLPGKGTTEGTK